MEAYKTREDNYYWPESICSETALTASMQYYANNASLLPILKRRAREYAECHFDWRRNSCNLSSILENKVDHHRHVDRKTLKDVISYERIHYPGTLERFGCDSQICCRKGLPYYYEIKRIAM